MPDWVEVPLDCDAKKMFDPGLERKTRNTVPEASLKGVQRFLTHFNGSRPFAVYIFDSSVWVYAEQENTFDPYTDTDDDDTSTFEYHHRLVAKFSPLEIMVGCSLLNGMTAWSGGHGEDFNGNSILLRLHDLEYVFIGDYIMSFTALSKIVSYVSPVGNNDIPYPYAVDEHDRYYLMDSLVVLHKFQMDEKWDDPVSWFYSVDDFIVSNHINIRDASFGGFVGYSTIDDETGIREDDSIVRFTTEPVEHYRKYELPYVPELIREDGSRVACTEEMFVSLMHQFMDMYGITVMDSRQLIGRS